MLPTACAFQFKPVQSRQQALVHQEQLFSVLPNFGALLRGDREQQKPCLDGLIRIHQGLCKSPLKLPFRSLGQYNDVRLQT